MQIFPIFVRWRYSVLQKLITQLITRYSIMKYKYYLLAVLFWLSPGFFLTGHTQNIKLDSTFGQAGRVITDHGSFDVCTDLGIQKDKKIISCGDILGDSERFQLIRYLPNGVIDSSFGNAGLAGIQLGNAGTIAFAIDIQHDDKIVMTGTTADTLDGVSDSDVFVARFLKDGQIDSTFGQNGAVRFFHQGWDEKGWAIAEQHQGRIIVGGSQLINTASASAIFMLDSLGNPVPTFGVNGMYLDLNTFSAHTIIVRPNGDFIVASQSPGPETTAFYAFLANGQPNPAFGQNGIAYLDLIPGNNAIERVWSGFFLPDGSLIAGGDFRGFSAVKIRPDGTIDQSFGQNGLCLGEFPGNRYLLSQGVTCLPQADGKFLITGLLVDAINDDYGIVRYNANGTLDTSFGDQGWIANDMTGTQDWCYATLWQDTNQLLLGGYSIGNGKVDIGLARYSVHIPTTPPQDSMDNTTEPIRIQAFPNPSRGMYSLEYQLEQPGDFMLHVYDSSARRVRTLQWTETVTGVETTHPLDLLDLADGYYVLQVLLQEKQYLFPVIKAN